jgi:branched-subunit amino acid transport protein
VGRLEALLSAAWASVVAVGAGTVALKAVGPVAIGGRRLPPRLVSLLSMLAPALLAALVVTETFASGRRLVVDARVAGLAAGGLAVLLRAPIWLVIVGAAATAAARHVL